MIRINLDKNSIDKLILNYSLEQIEKKLELLKIKRNIINPAGWLIATLKTNYVNPELFNEEMYEGKDIIEAEEVKPESKMVKPEKILPEKKEKEEKKKLS